MAGLDSFGETAQALIDFIGDRPLVGFNVSFDKQILNAELKRHGFKTFHRKRSHCVQNTLHGPWGYRPSLGNAVLRMGQEEFTEGLHDPLTDALATATTLAGMLAGLTRAQVKNAPGSYWTGRASANEPPTEKQLNLIRKLSGRPSRAKTREEASELIDHLKMMRKMDRRFGEDDAGPGCLMQMAAVVVLGFFVLLLAAC